MIQQPYCDQCAEDNRCTVIDSECVVYHQDDDKVSRLVCLGLLNKSNVQSILDGIDEKLCMAASLQTPLVLIDSPSVNLNYIGTGNHKISADVLISANAGNGLSNIGGLYAPLNNYKVKVKPSGVAEYLEDKLIGGTDGRVTTSVFEMDDVVKVQPSIDINALLDELALHYSVKMCDLFSNC